jgi:hypothetical protein
MVVWAFRKENVRILVELKRYVEAQPKRRHLKTIGTPEGRYYNTCDRKSLIEGS